MMDKMPLRKNDVVVVQSGKDRGKTGKVLKVIPEKKRVIVEKINFVKEFIRRDQSKNIQGGIMEKEAPIHISNLMLYCTDCGQGVKLRNKRLEDGSKIRVCAKCEASLEKAK
jgi:large subunit ribosomal protein L24